MFRKSQSSAAAILYSSGLLFLRQSRSPGLSQPDTARYGRLTLIAGPAHTLLSRKGRSTSPSPEPKPDAFLSVFRRTSFNIPPKWKVRIFLLGFLTSD